jgi:hypothetical protein
LCQLQLKYTFQMQNKKENHGSGSDN